MFSLTLKRSFATLAVMVGLLAAAGPASAAWQAKYDGIDGDVVSRDAPGAPDAGVSNLQARAGVNLVAWRHSVVEGRLAAATDVPGAAVACDGRRSDVSAAADGAGDDRVSRTLADIVDGLSNTLRSGLVGSASDGAAESASAGWATPCDVVAINQHRNGQHRRVCVTGGLNAGHAPAAGSLGDERRDGQPARDRPGARDRRGRGHLGTAERVALCGGGLPTGPWSDGGFEVRARPPLVQEPVGERRVVIATSGGSLAPAFG